MLDGEGVYFGKIGAQTKETFMTKATNALLLSAAVIFFRRK